MSTPRVPRGTHTRTCDSCGWTGTHDTPNRADHALRRHSCARHTARTERHQRALAREAAVDRTPKPCHHKQADHQHGTYACYTLDACRCEPCAAACSTYLATWTREKGYGRWDNLVDATPARNHVQALQAHGMGHKRIADTAGISVSALQKLLWGHKGRPPSKRIRKATAQALLAVTLDLPTGGRIPADETARRLQALIACGWSASSLARRLDMLPSNMTPLVHARRGVTVATATAVHQLYLQLADVAPPQDTRHQRTAVSRAKAWAAREGWAPPVRVAGRLVGGTLHLAPDLDEDATPDATVHDLVDEAAVLRRLAGDKTIRLRPAESLEVARRADAAGMSRKQIQSQLGLKPERYLPNKTA